MIQAKWYNITDTNALRLGKSIADVGSLVEVLGWMVSIVKWVLKLRVGCSVRITEHISSSRFLWISKSVWDLIGSFDILQPSGNSRKKSQRRSKDVFLLPSNGMVSHKWDCSRLGFQLVSDANAWKKKKKSAVVEILDSPDVRRLSTYM